MSIITSESNTGTLDAMDHIAISVGNIQQAVDWYSKHFKCRVHYQNDTWAMLEFANIRLALVVPRQHPPHLSFVSDQAEAFGPLETHRDGTRSAYVTDPAGNTVEIMARD